MGQFFGNESYNPSWSFMFLILMCVWRGNKGGSHRSETCCREKAEPWGCSPKRSLSTFPSEEHGDLLLLLFMGFSDSHLLHSEGFEDV